MSFEDYYVPPRIQYRDRTLTKSESMARKTYRDPRCRLENFYRQKTVPYDDQAQFLETSYIYHKTDVYNGYDNNAMIKVDFFDRPRTLSFSDMQTPLRKRNGRSIRDRNRRRQSYNPKAYETSSSESDCVSVGSADFEWRRRKRLSRLTGSNTSIRSEMVKRSTNPFLKPGFSVKMMGKSPPPSNSALSGLSPTSVSRCKRSSNSTSSDSSL